MRKSNWIIAAVLVVASIFFLWLWYYLKFNFIDNPLDLVLSIIWWAIVGLGCFGIKKAEDKRQERVRTTYVANTAVFNSEAGLVDLNGATAVEGIQQVLEGLEYNFDIKDFPSQDQAKFDYIVRSKKFEVEKEDEQAAAAATGAAEGAEAAQAAAEAAEAAGTTQVAGTAQTSLKKVKTWEGEVALVSNPDADPKEFSSKEELAAILAA